MRLSKPRKGTMTRLRPIGAALLLVVGCGGSSTQNGEPSTPGAAGSLATGSSGDKSAGGDANGGASGTAVVTVVGGTGVFATGGSAGGAGSAGGSGEGGGGSNGNGGSAGAAPLPHPPAAISGAITQVVKSDGCGQRFAGQ